MDKSKNQSHVPHNIHICEICEKELKSKRGLRTHFDTFHNKEKQFQCNVCNKDFPKQIRLNYHMKSVHENKKHHKCDSCGKAFSHPGHMKSHISSVHNGKKNTNVTHVESHFLKLDT